MPDAVTKESKVVNSVHKNAILAETIKKEMREYQLYDKYQITPTIKQNIVINSKPNTTNTQLDSKGGDAEYLALAAKQDKAPRDKFDKPQTTAQEYFWETHQLVNDNLTNALFHHPRRSSEITKFYGTGH